MPLYGTAVIFDLDGTLVDTAPDLTAALNKVLDDAGHRSVPLSEVTHLVGDGARALVERGFDMVGAPLAGVALEAQIESFIAYYGAHLADESRPYEGVEETLQALHDEGARLGVCTNKRAHFSQRLLDEIGLARYFAAIAGGDSLPVKKPDPRHVLAAIEWAGGQPECAVMVGDSLKDMEAARGAGVACVAVAYGYGANAATLAAADAVIATFAELPGVLARLS